MSTTKFSEKTIVGITVRTSNENMQAATDIPKLWQRFVDEKVADQITGKVDQKVYCVYTDYETDQTGPYTTFLGYQVTNPEALPDGLEKCVIPAGEFANFSAKGDLTAGALYEAWMQIWNSGLKRKYTADFECYDERATNPKDGEVDIFIAI